MSSDLSKIHNIPQIKPKGRQDTRAFVSYSSEPYRVLRTVEYVSEAKKRQKTEKDIMITDSSSKLG